MEYQKEGGHFAIDSGADMVLGGHSHQPQPIELYKGKPILYSLANYVHDKASFRELSSMTILVRCLLRNGKLERLAYIPGTIKGSGPPEFTKPSQLPMVVKRISEMSSPFGTRFEIGEEDVVVKL
jgi:poly-gamma-glutamate capsule biosynthesis protein CapA/YwtB (metallophosphatase superfamily)